MRLMPASFEAGNGLGRLGLGKAHHVSLAGYVDTYVGKWRRGKLFVFK
jgi:hypothetical protein